jgi:hypothetical protein
MQTEEHNKDPGDKINNKTKNKTNNKTNNKINNNPNNKNHNNKMRKKTGEENKTTTPDLGVEAIIVITKHI